MHCIKLNQGYKDAYSRVKNRRVGRDIREFSFSEKYIFGRYVSEVNTETNIINELFFRVMVLWRI